MKEEVPISESAVNGGDIAHSLGTIGNGPPAAKALEQNGAKHDIAMSDLAQNPDSGSEKSALGPIDKMDGQTSSQPAVSKAKTQNPFICYPRPDGKGYIVDGTPRIPLCKKNGETVVNKRVQETWPTQESAEQRAREINDLVLGRRVIPTIQSNLNEEQNSAAEEFFLAYKLQPKHLVLVGNLFRKTNWSTEHLEAIEEFFLLDEFKPANLRAAARMFRKLKHVGRMEWNLEKLVDHCVATKHRQDDKVPMMPDALDQYIQIREKGDESKPGFREGSSHTAKWIVSLLKAAFPSIRADQFTDDVALEWINGDSPLERAETITMITIEDGIAIEKPVTRIVPSEAERPWSIGTNNNVRARVKAIRNWFAGKGWGAPSKIQKLKENDDIIQNREIKNRVLTTQEKRTILKNAYKYKPPGKQEGFYAAHFVQRLFGGCRKKDTERFDPKGFREEEGKIGLTRAQTKTRKSRNTTCMPNYTLMAADLKSRGLFNKENLNPPKNVIQDILAMSGFWYEHEKYQKKFKDVMIPDNFFPFNALRRSAMSAHFQVTEDAATTSAWAGTSRSQWDTWYERSYSKQEAREHWQMVPPHMEEMVFPEDLALLLPEGHKLDNVIKEPLRKLIERTKQSAKADEETATSDNLKAV